MKWIQQIGEALTSKSLNLDPNKQLYLQATAPKPVMVEKNQDIKKR